MTEIALFDAKNRLSSQVDRVLAGEVIVITRRGKPVAQLILPRDADAKQRAEDAIAQLQAVRRGVSLRGLKSHELIAQSRR